MSTALNPGARSVGAGTAVAELGGGGADVDGGVSGGVPDLSVIVVTHNRADLALATLGSAQAVAGGLDVEWLVVDSGSRDGTPEAIEAAHADVRVLREGNIGFAAANNRALAFARGRYVLLLNPDVVTAAGTFAELVAQLDEHPEVGVASVVQSAPDGSLQYSIRRFPSVWLALGEALGVARWRPLRRWREEEPRAQRYDASQSADWLVGAFLIARREAVRAVGGLDERFFLYSEEIDWCYRFKRSGWDVRHLPVMTVTHHTGEERPADLMAQLSYAKVLFARKHYSPARAAAIQAAHALRHALRAGVGALPPVRTRWAGRAAAERRALAVLLGRVAPPFGAAPCADLEVAPRPDRPVAPRADPRAALRVETLDPLSDPRWQRFVEGSPSGGIFHHSEWLALLHAQYRYPLLARCVSADGELLAGLPFAHVRSRLTGERLVAVPFSDVCGPVLAGGDRDAEALGALLDAVRAEHRREGVDVEIRTPLESFGHGAGFYHHELALAPDAEQLRRGFSKGVKSGISRARREGVEVRRASDRAALGQFYDLHLRTRRRQGVPTQPKRFIERFAALFEQDLGFVLLACVGDEPVAAAVFLAFNGVLTYKYGASNPARLKLQPNNALLMAALSWGCEHGLHTFDLGRTDLENEGLRAFKRGWGATERELAYSCLPAREVGAARGGVPSIVKTAISRTPPLAGRLVGAALYRHFG